MSKNKKSKNTNPVKAEKENLSAVSDVTKQVETVEENSKTEVNVVKENKKVEDKKQKNDKKKKSKKEKGSFKRKTKETFSEFKKVSWPSFGEVCKKTGVVLVVVLVFAVVLFGIDYGLGALMSLLKK